MFRKASAGQSTVRRHGNVVLSAEFCHFPLLLPENQIVMSLNRDKPGKSFFFGKCVCLSQLIGKTVGNTNVPNLSGLYNTIKAIHDIIKRRLIIPHMVNVEIHIIEPQIF